jgi:Ca-activated chloride channel homolog
MKTIRALICCILAVCVAFATFAQTKTVTGKITDNSGQPVAGVTVRVKGIATATVSDIYGNYKIALPLQGTVILQFSAAGMETREVEYKGEAIINITMTATQHLQEVVVTAYVAPRYKKRDIAGSTQKVNELYAQGLSLQGSLTGKAPGTVVQGSASHPSVVLRGISSLHTGSPLVVIDGVPQTQFDYNKIDPNQVQSVEVLKDAAATALYGAKAASGAVIIATKSGTKNFYRPPGTDFNTEDYAPIVENRFLATGINPLSTFSIDVDAASYSNVRRFLNKGKLPPAGAVRLEEMVNYFKYEYKQPKGEHPFSMHTEISACPWNPDHRMVLIGLQGKTIAEETLPPSNLVFLVDVSGSMNQPDKLPLVKASLKLLADQVRPQDKIAIVVYAGNAGLVLPATSGDNREDIHHAIDRLEAGGSTAGGEGILLAYKTAKENFIKNGNNRVILCTDGDFNVGISSDSELETLIEEKRKTGVFLTILGFGTGNYQDAKMQILAHRGNGNHAYIDGIAEARKVLVNEFSGTLFTIAKDIKLQIEFNPAKVQAYRLIGYENRLLNKEDFNNDAKDAGDMGSGHTVTALYEVIPVGVNSKFIERVDSLKYQHNDAKLSAAAGGNELMTIKFRYKKPDADVSRLMELAVVDKQTPLEKTSSNFRFATAVAEFALLLRNSEFKARAAYEAVLRRAGNALGKDTEGYRSEFVKLVANAHLLAKGKQIVPVETEEDMAEGGER